MISTRIVGLESYSFRPVGQGAVVLGLVVVLATVAAPATAGTTAPGPTVTNATGGTTSPGGNVTVTVESADATEIDVTGVPPNWTVVSHRDDFGTYADQVATESRVVWLWPARVSANVSVTFTVPADASPGTYNLTALPWAGTTTGTETQVTVTVTNATAGTNAPDIPGLPTDVYRAAAGADGDAGDLTRADVVSAVRSYIRSSGSVNGVDAERSVVVRLLRYYIQQAVGR